MRRERGALATAVALVAAVGWTGCGDRAAARSPALPPTFADDVAPILFFDAAVAAAERGIEAAASAGAERAAATLRELLALFRQGRAYTSGTPGGSS